MQIYTMLSTFQVFFIKVFFNFSTKFNNHFLIQQRKKMYNRVLVIYRNWQIQKLYLKLIIYCLLLNHLKNDLFPPVKQLGLSHTNLTTLCCGNLLSALDYTTFQLKEYISLKISRTLQNKLSNYFKFSKALEFWSIIKTSSFLR